MCHCLLYDDTITIVYSAAVQLHYNGNGTRLWILYGCEPVLIFIEYMKRCCVTNRKYVGIGLCLNLNVPSLGIRCTNIITSSQLHTRLLFNYNANDIRLCADVDDDWMYIMDVVILTLDKQKVRCYWFMFELECVIIWCMIHARYHHHNCTLTCYSYTLQW